MYASVVNHHMISVSEFYYFRDVILKSRSWMNHLVSFYLAVQVIGWICGDKMVC